MRQTSPTCLVPLPQERISVGRQAWPTCLVPSPQESVSVERQTPSTFFVPCPQLVLFPILAPFYKCLDKKRHHRSSPLENYRNSIQPCGAAPRLELSDVSPPG